MVELVALRRVEGSQRDRSYQLLAEGSDDLIGAEGDPQKRGRDQTHYGD